MFEAVHPKVSFTELEQHWLAYWAKEQVFELATQGRNQLKSRYVFFEGPPTANGMPHPGHVLTRVMKDVFLRYRTMCGDYVPRRAGWDTHGLPVEVEVEKELGITGRAAIEEYGVEAFTRRCLESVFRYIDEWRKMTQRIAFWVDLDQAYVTFHRSYVESCWWALAELYKKGLLYRDYKVVWWWPQGGTALSSGEVGQGYKTVDDPSLFVRFPLEGEENTFFLAWTTTPWTLPSNVALALHPEEEYVLVEAEIEAGKAGSAAETSPLSERLVLARKACESVLGKRNYRILESRKGEGWVGQRYRPLFDYATPSGGEAYVVVGADFVTLDSGSGIVHIAPAFGEDDFRVAKEKGLGFLQLLKPDGTFPEQVRDFAGRFCKSADRDIIRHLRERGLVFAEAAYRHEYPFCWRKDSDPLIQYARRSWFIRTTQEIDKVIANNGKVQWEPEHIQEGRFGSFLRTNVDWALSRERFWGTPLPIWINDQTGAIDVVSSLAEIEERNPEALRPFEEARAKDPKLSEHLVVHKPWVDDITWTRPNEPGVYRRVPDVIDCWFDSGCMPCAQWGYPHQNAEAFEANFPADMITEAVDQTRGWFYSLIAISTLLFPERTLPHPYKRCLVLGLISDKKGQKLSKSKRNYSDPLELIEKHGADAVRWSFYQGTVPGQPTRFFDDAVIDAIRDFLLKIWNVYSFFVTYANIDRWHPVESERPARESRADLDRWILAELDDCVVEVRKQLDGLRSHLAARRLNQFVDSLSNWYVRRSRARFWAAGSEPDKLAAFATLYEVLVELTKVIAPFTPFLAETLYQNLLRPYEKDAPLSVHLSAFPLGPKEVPDADIRRAMSVVQQIVALGQRVRAERKLKVRQPLRKAIVVVADPEERRAIEPFVASICDELNVHELSIEENSEAFVRMEVLPNFRVLGPKLGARMPACQKALKAQDGARLLGEIDTRGSTTLPLPEGEPIELCREDLELRLHAKDDYAAAAYGGSVVVLDVRLDAELLREGLAREFINRVQRARKELDLPHEARIELRYQTSGELLQAIEKHAESIREETLTASLAPYSAVDEDMGHLQESEVEGEALRFWLRPKT